MFNIEWYMASGRSGGRYVGAGANRLCRPAPSGASKALRGFSFAAFIVGKSKMYTSFLNSCPTFLPINYKKNYCISMWFVGEYEYIQTDDANREKSFAETKFVWKRLSFFPWESLWLRQTSDYSFIRPPPSRRPSEYTMNAGTFINNREIINF